MAEATRASPPADPEPDAKKRESGERGYVEIAGFLRSYIDRLNALAGYAPPDAVRSVFPRREEKELRTAWSRVSIPQRWQQSLPHSGQNGQIARLNPQKHRTGVLDYFEISRLRARRER